MRLISTATLATIALALHAGDALAADAHGFVRITQSELKWTPIPGAHGAQTAVLLGDPDKPGMYVIRAKFPPHVMDTPHTHSGGDRYVTVLQGRWCTGTGPDFDPAKAVKLGVGAVMKHPSGAVHWDGSCTQDEVIVQIIGERPADTQPIEPTRPLWVQVR